MGLLQKRIKQILDVYPIIPATSLDKASSTLHIAVGYNEFQDMFNKIIVEEMRQEFPKSHIRTVGAWGEYNDEYYDSTEIIKWFQKWLGEKEEN